MLKLGLLTSWNTQCGIAEYSRYLTGAFQRRDDVEVIVFGSKNYGARKVAEDESYVVPTFGVLPWNNEGDHSLDVEKILAAKLDVLHVQYECVLYNQPRLKELLEKFQGVKVITFHDNCIPPDLDFSLFNLGITHRDTVGVGPRCVFPFGIEDRTPVVKTFGLGRSRLDIIGDICTRNGWQFEHSFGEHNWKTTEELTTWLRDSDAIVLYYDEVPSAGSSQAARTAIGTRRPVIVNDTTWFQGVEGAHAVVNSPEHLEQTLKDLLYNPVIKEASWDRIAATTLNLYLETKEALA